MTKDSIVPADIYKEMDKRDEDQIMLQLSNVDSELLKIMVYEVHGQVQLSWAGVKECARRMGSIKLVDPTIQEDNEKYTVIVKAVDEENHLEFWGVASQRKVMETKKGSVPDDFALQKALSKAQRNATRAVIPEAMLQAMIQSFMDAKRGKRAGGAPETQYASADTSDEFTLSEDARTAQATPPPADQVTDDMREAALHTIREFIKDNAEKRSIVAAMAKTKQVDIDTVTPDQIPDDVLAFIVGEINKVNGSWDGKQTIL